MKRYQANDKFLRRTLFANALFSAISGLALLVVAAPIAGVLFNLEFTVLGFEPSTVLLAIGLGLITFAAFVARAAKQTLINLAHVKLISLSDVLWVALSAAVLILYPSYLSALGYEIVAIVAVVATVFAIDQLLGLAVIYEGESDVNITIDGDKMTLTASCHTTASPKRVWQVMSHQEAYADVADNLSKVEVIEGEGRGMIRRCHDTKGKAWRETCTLWDDGRSFAFRVHTEAADYPYPIAQLTGEWSLAPTEGQTRIEMVFAVQAKSGIINRILFKMMSTPFAKTCDRLLNKWVASMEGRAAPKAEVPTHGSTV